jgi:RNA polymerase sigma-70 factor (ECF subfamily)
MAPAPAPEFNELVDLYYQPLYRFALSLSRNESDASDLTQETFLIWADKGSSLRDGAKVKSWLFTTLYREFLRGRRRGKRELDIDTENLEADLPAVEPDLARTLDGRLALDAIDEVDEVYREPLMLFYLEGLAYKDIAEILDIPIGTVMSRLSRGKSQLKQLLRKKRK